MKKFVSAILIFALCLQVASCNKDNGHKKHKDRKRHDETIEETNETTFEETEATEVTEPTEIPAPELDNLEFIPYSFSYSPQKIMEPDIREGWAPSVSYSFEYTDIEECNYPELISTVSRYKDGAFSECSDFFATNLEEFEASGYSSDASALYDSYCTVYRADSLAFSYLVTTYTSAGTNYTYEISSHNINPSTGEEISLSDICNADALLPVLFSYMETSGDVSNYKSDWQNAITEMLNNGSLIYTMAPDGIYIFFNDSDIAAEGRWIRNNSFKIPYINNEDILSGNYFEVITEDYCLYLDTNNEIYYDFDNDGETDYLSVNPVINSYDCFESFECTYNGNAINYEAYGYYTETFVVHKDGRNFLYVSCSEDNDYRSNYIFELTNDGIEPVSDFSGRAQRIVNPSDFEYSTRIHALSTMEGYANASVLNDGTFNISDVYELRTTIVLISSTELEGELLDSNGMPTGETITIGAYSEYHFYSTDGETYIDFGIYDQNSDTFTDVRFSVNLDWADGQHIEGQRADECFVMLYYAG